MFARPKSSVFIDSVIFELTGSPTSALRAILKNEDGCVCSRLEAFVPSGLTVFRWNGLSDLPYGVYTLELSEGGEEHRMRMVKRV